MKKLIVNLLLFFLFIPFVCAENGDFYTYQKLKNVTKNDPPAGSNLTIGFIQDEIRFLVFVQNTSKQNKTFVIKDILPQYLLYESGSAFVYKVGSGTSWQKIVETSPEFFPLQNYTFEVEPDTGYYFKFSTTVSSEIPANNLTLSNFVNLYDQNNSLLKQTATKLLIPNSAVKQVTNEEIAPAEKDYINQVLKEEQEFIEKTFFELKEQGFEFEETKDKVMPDSSLEEPQNQAQADSNQNCSIKYKLIIMSGILLLLIYLLITRITKLKFPDK